jgi:hypothetical protein
MPASVPRPVRSVPPIFSAPLLPNGSPDIPWARSWLMPEPSGPDAGADAANAQGRALSGLSGRLTAYFRCSRLAERIDHGAEPFGRRSANACDWSRTHDQSATASDRRSNRGACAPHRPRDLAHPRSHPSIRRYRHHRGSRCPPPRQDRRARHCAVQAEIVFDGRPDRWLRHDAPSSRTSVYEKNADCEADQVVASWMHYCSG